MTINVQVKGKNTREFEHLFDTYVEGRANSAFNIFLSNMSNEDKNLIVSVDGYGVMDDLPASKNSKGFVLAVGENAHITKNIASGKELCFFGDDRVDYRSGGVIGVAEISGDDIDIQTIYYDDVRGLKRRGIVLDDNLDAFPGIKKQYALQKKRAID